MATFVPPAAREGEHWEQHHGRQQGEHPWQHHREHSCSTLVQRQHWLLQLKAKCSSPFLTFCLHALLPFLSTAIKTSITNASPAHTPQTIIAGNPSGPPRLSLQVPPGALTESRGRWLVAVATLVGPSLLPQSVGFMYRSLCFTCCCRALMHLALISATPLPCPPTTHLVFPFHPSPLAGHSAAALKGATGSTTTGASKGGAPLAAAPTAPTAAAVATGGAPPGAPLGAPPPGNTFEG
ncbi:hypothetical protein CLOM_g12005 [Closterium sp. NIES-68]|nr:hypothetical protein CLOM_g12005 [Closterium sp. NIES-68]